MVGGPGFEPGASWSRTDLMPCPPVSRRLLQCPPERDLPRRRASPVRLVPPVPGMRDPAVIRRKPDHSYRDRFVPVEPEHLFVGALRAASFPPPASQGVLIY